MIGCVGDVHLGAQDHIVPGAYKKVISTLDKIVTRLEDKGCREVVQLGDTFNTPLADNDHLIALMETILAHPKVHWSFIMGNHDKANIKEHSLRILKWLGMEGVLNCVVYTKPKVVKIEGEKYFMCPHPAVMDAPKEVRYAFGHFGYKGAKSDTGYVLNKGAEPKGRWILGDYHTPQSGKGYIYAGSIVQVKWYEGPRKGFIELDEDPRFVEWKPDLRLGKKEINKLRDLEELDRDIYWEVKFGASVKLPPDWAVKYPHVVRHSIDKIPSERAQILMKRVASENPLSGLSNYLRSNLKLSDKELATAAKILKLDELP